MTTTNDDDDLARGRSVPVESATGSPRSPQPNSSPQCLVCATIGNFADDVDAQCATCGAPIQHRPHAPADVVPICISCASELFAASPAPQIAVTAETLREVALYYAKPKGGSQ